MIFDLIKRLRAGDDELFRHLIDVEFSRELRSAQALAEIPSDEKDSNHMFLEDHLRRKYRLSGECPSKLYFKASKSLKREYNVIHRRIINLLYENPRFSSKD